LQGVQWVQGLVVVRVSWPKHPELSNKKRNHHDINRNKETHCN